jgi:hypothetical protein
MGKDLDCHVTTQTGVACAVDFAHPASPDRLRYLKTPRRRPVRLDTALFCTSLQLMPAVCEHCAMPETSPLTIAPAFTLQSAKGDIVTLDALLERGRILLVFHRGTW